jgi:hypothetical protein
MATESERIQEFRKQNGCMADEIRHALNIIQGAKGKDLSRNGLYNVGIIYNNKISELIRIFHEHGLEFFDGNALSDVIQYKLETVYSMAVERLNAYVTNNIGTYYNEYFYLKRSDRKELDQYKELTEVIFNYDIEKELADSICMMLNRQLANPEFASMFYFMHGKIKDDIVETLKKLGYTGIVDECSCEIEYHHQILGELYKEAGVDSNILFGNQDTPPSL